MATKHLILTPDRNERGNDFAGAFKPESDRYARFYMDRGDVATTVRVDVSRSKRRRAESVRDAVWTCGNIDRLALFCHGWRDGVQLGLGSGDEDDRAELAVFAGTLYASSTPALAVALYCCSTAEGANGGSFASYLFNAVRERGRPGVRVFAHSDSGHATRNADIVMFASDYPAGECPAERGTPAYRRLDARLHDKSDDLRWRAPYMTIAELRAELESGR